MSAENDGGMILTGENRRTRRKTCTSVSFSAINPTWIDPGAKPGLRGESPATNRLSHGTALFPGVNRAERGAALRRWLLRRTHSACCVASRLIIQVAALKWSGWQVQSNSVRLRCAVIDSEVDSVTARPMVSMEYGASLVAIHIQCRDSPERPAL
jgi:hypothetical protein